MHFQASQAACWGLSSWKSRDIVEVGGSTLGLETRLWLEVAEGRTVCVALEGCKYALDPWGIVIGIWAWYRLSCGCGIRFSTYVDATAAGVSRESYTCKPGAWLSKGGWTGGPLLVDDGWPWLWIDGGCGDTCGIPLYCSVYGFGGPVEGCLITGVVVVVALAGSTSASFIATSTGAWMPWAKTSRLLPSSNNNYGSAWRNRNHSRRNKRFKDLKRLHYSP